MGFEARRLVVFDVAPGRNGYDEERTLRLYTRLLDRLRQTPGVTDASVAGERLMTGWEDNGSFLVEGSRKRARAMVNFVGPDYLRTMRIPLVLGRDLAARDLSSGSAVAVINESTARRHFGDGSPLGRRFRWSEPPNPEIELIGVACDARYSNVRQGLGPPSTLLIPSAPTAGRASSATRSASRAMRVRP